MKNYAGVKDCDDALAKELEDAGIDVYRSEIFKNGKSEVNTSVIGTLDPSGWGFRRAWYYWVADGPGIPPEIAEELHKEWGKEVRVEGHCGCPSPLEWRKGFAIGNYHIDTQEGLKALADVIKKILNDNGIKTA